MIMNKTLFSLFLAILSLPNVYADTVRVATFNVSMEASNYQPKGASEHSGEVLLNLLKSGEHQQIRNIAEIIQRVNTSKSVSEIKAFAAEVKDIPPWQR